MIPFFKKLFIKHYLRYTKNLEGIWSLAFMLRDVFSFFGQVFVFFFFFYKWSFFFLRVFVFYSGQKAKTLNRSNIVTFNKNLKSSPRQKNFF